MFHCRVRGSLVYGTCLLCYVIEGFTVESYENCVLTHTSPHHTHTHTHTQDELQDMLETEHAKLDTPPSTL